MRIYSMRYTAYGMVNNNFAQPDSTIAINNYYKAHWFLKRTLLISTQTIDTLV